VNQKYDKLLSTCAFESNFRLYIMAMFETEICVDDVSVNT